MTNQDYQSSIKAPISAKEAFDKISRVSEWWAQNFKGSASKLGDTFTVRFGKTFVDFKIIEVIPEKRIVWQVTNCNLHWIKNKTEWNNTRIVWDISTEKEATTVRMTHVGLVPGVECYENCEEGWNFHFGKSLLQFFTKGKGLPK